MTKSIRKKAGFTLIEILLASAIFALVAVSGVGSLSAIARSLIQTKDQRHLSEVAREAMNSIAEIVRSSSAVGFEDAPSGGYLPGSQFFNIFPSPELSTSSILLFDAFKEGEVYRIRRHNPGGKDKVFLTPSDITITEFSVGGHKSADSNKKIQPYLQLKVTFATTQPDQSGKIHSLTLRSTLTPRNWKKTSY